MRCPIYRPYSLRGKAFNYRKNLSFSFMRGERWQSQSKILSNFQKVLYTRQLRNQWRTVCMIFAGCLTCSSFHEGRRKSALCRYMLSSFYPREAMLARVIVIATCLCVCLSVRLSVCPSVTRQYCVKTKKASGMISSPSASPKTLVFWRQISSPNSKGFPPNGSLKQGSVGKIQPFSSFKRQYPENGSRYGQSYY